MSKPSMAVALCVLLGAAAPALAGSVEVKFVDAERYADAGNSKWDEPANLKTLATHLQSLGTRYLPADQKLNVEVLDVDLAGEKRWRRGQELRILRGRADWPRITLRYTLQDAAGNTLRQSEETVSDPAYQQRGAFGEQEPLRYEKQMLDDWFRKSFAPRQARAHG